MAKVDDLTFEVKKILGTTFNVREGTVIPDTTTVSLSGGAVKISAAFLYADLAGSSEIAKKCPWETTAKVIRAYLDICTRLIRLNGGEIRSFDGDRVMGIFKSDSPNTQAVKCAQQIDWMVHNILNPEAQTRFASLKDIRIKHCVGVDYGEVRAVRAGIRNNNDLIWIGRAPSFAAKLSDIRTYPYEVYISKTSYDRANISNKETWGQITVKYAGNDETVFRTKTPISP